MLINEGVASHNCTTEGGAFGAVPFLQNVTGSWLLESCRKKWQSQGLVVDYDDLLQAVAKIAVAPLIEPDDSRLFHPPSMLAVMGEQLREQRGALARLAKYRTKRT